MSGPVKWDECQEIVTITLCRPEALNALDGRTMDALEKAVERLYRRNDLRGVILTGEGDKAFCVGGDLKWLTQLTLPEHGARMSQKMHRILGRLEAVSCPLITVVNGYALGGGAELALVGDMIVVEESAMICFKQGQMGLITGWGGGGRLVRRIGYARAFELLVTGRKLTPKDAFELGLANRIAQSGEGRADALRILEQTAATSRRSIKAIKSLFKSAQSLSSAEVDDLEAELFKTVWQSPEHQQAVDHFLRTRGVEKPSP